MTRYLYIPPSTLSILPWILSGSVPIPHSHHFVHWSHFWSGRMMAAFLCLRACPHRFFLQWQWHDMDLYSRGHLSHRIGSRICGEFSSYCVIQGHFECALNFDVRPKFDQRHSLWLKKDLGRRRERRRELAWAMVNTLRHDLAPALYVGTTSSSCLKRWQCCSLWMSICRRRRSCSLDPAIWDRGSQES